MDSRSASRGNGELSEFNRKSARALDGRVGPFILAVRRCPLPGRPDVASTFNWRTPADALCTIELILQARGGRRLTFGTSRRVFSSLGRAIGGGVRGVFIAPCVRSDATNRLTGWKAARRVHPVDGNPAFRCAWCQPRLIARPVERIARLSRDGILRERHFRQRQKAKGRKGI